MGMATYVEPQTPEPQGKGTVVCKNPRCHAEYAPSPNWCWGYNTGIGTTRISEFISLGSIAYDVCPCCRTKRED